jgi:AraC family transcriptional regulator
MELRTLKGAKAVRVVHPGGQAIEEHRHDWPSLTLYVLGGCTELYDGGDAALRGPSAVLHPAGRPHADRVDDCGLETVSIQFDPAWLRQAGHDLRLDRSRCWTGGAVAAEARRLAAAWRQPDLPEHTLADATGAFVSFALAQGEELRPAWLERVVSSLEGETPTATATLARGLDLHPAWLARAYRAATGEGLQETVRRKRVQLAVDRLRGSDCGLAEIAATAGFCDQSHMNRGFQAVLGRTPMQVRAERKLLSRFTAAA